MVMPVVSVAAEQTDQTAQAAEKAGEVPPAAGTRPLRLMSGAKPSLRELSALATKLERQRKFNDFLRDRVDILNHRIETLEAANKEQAARLKALAEVPSVAPDAQDAGKQAKSDNTAPETKAPPVEADKKDREAGKMPEDFAQFLDLGEAMMRRFFGVVQEFRKEFEDNRV